MNSARQILHGTLGLARDYPASLVGGWKHRKLLDSVPSYAMFIGYPRSGHSIIGALLDAHPNIVIAHELDALQYIFARFGRRQLFYLLIQRSRQHAHTAYKRGGYVYEIPSSWKGRFDDLHVVGDKHGESTTLRLQADLNLVSRLRKTVGGDVKWIHVIRNPYDNISTIREKTRRHGARLNLRQSIDYYFSLCETVLAVRSHIDEKLILDVRHEAFVEDPESQLIGLCRFLGVDAPRTYLDDASSIVFKTVRKSRYEGPWTPELIDEVSQRYKRIPYLSDYTFED